MAHIIEENIIIKVSKLVKSATDSSESLVTDEIISALESVAEELVDKSAVVEIIKA